MTNLANFFETYIGYSGLCVMAGLLIAILSDLSMDENAGLRRPSAGGNIGIVLGLLLAVIGAIAWVVVWKLEQM